MDFVRLETASALKRDIPVIPVLVRGASMPRAEQLPPDLAELAYRNAVELTHARWDSDVQVLVKALRPHVELLQKDVGSAKTEPAARAPGKAWTAGTVGPSGEPGVGGTAPVTTAQSAKKSWRLIVAMSVGAIAVAVGGYVGYEKVAEKAKLDRIAEAEKVAANQGRKADEKVPVAGPSASDYHRLEGKWQLTDRVSASSKSSYIGDEHRFDLWLTVDGNRVVGRAEKISYNGHNLPREKRPQLDISGTMAGEELRATFSEQGRRRRSTGQFTWRFTDGYRSFRGAFESTAGDTNGESFGTWLHE